VLVPSEVHVSRSLQKTLRSGRFRLTIDEAFSHVIADAREPRGGVHGTWITYGMQQAFVQMHEAGHAHSVEVWQDDDLVGGLYGVSIGRMFYGNPCSAGQRCVQGGPGDPVPPPGALGLSADRQPRPHPPT
jgi:leucyl/phenylalanyl-tRNA---protein transferase